MPTNLVLQTLNARPNPHQMSHLASGELDPKAPHQQRDRMLAELVSGFVRKLKNTKEADGSSLLDHSVTPLANLWLSMLRHVGVNTKQFANSKRVLTELGFK